MTRFHRSGHYRTSKLGVSHYVRDHEVERDAWDRSASSEWTSDWSLFSTDEPVTRVTRCWWCGTDVYFFRDHRGGCALFDELGAPWKVHACWEQHRSEQTAVLQYIDEQLRSEGYDGAYDPAEYDVYDLPSRSTILRPFWGVVLAVTDDEDWPGAYHAHSAEWMCVTVAHATTIYHALLIRRFATEVLVGVPVKVDCRCVYISGEPRLLVTGLEQPDSDGRTHWRGRLKGLSATPIICRFCGTRVGPTDAWAVTDREQIECAMCRAMRGDLAPARLISAARRIARHVSGASAWEVLSPRRPCFDLGVSVNCDDRFRTVHAEIGAVDSGERGAQIVQLRILKE